MTLFAPLQLRELQLKNRIAVSPMCEYSAKDGHPGRWYLVHLGSRAVGGAALVMTEGDPRRGGSPLARFQGPPIIQTFEKTCHPEPIRQG